MYVPPEEEVPEPAPIEIKKITDDPMAMRRLEGQPPPVEPQTTATAASAESDVTETEELPTLDEVLDQNSDTGVDDQENVEEEVHTIEIPKNWTRLFPAHEVWVDMKKKQVIAGGNICLNAGPLEVFVCPRYTKEHESVVSVNALAEQIHAALLAIGAEPGKPVQWIDEYKPASGDVIEVEVMWKQHEELIKRRGQELILNIKTGTTMKHDWVFGGSIVETLEATEEHPESSYYLANSGELVCVSNFSTATLDIPVKSSDANEGLLYEANTPNIPDVGTKAYVLFSKKK